MGKVSVRSRAERPYRCIVDGCNEDLNEANNYYKRHRLCVRHAMSAFIVVDNVESRFCQQCSKLHHPLLFDNNKKSCRISLACHNARRRKTAVKKTEIVKPAPAPVSTAAAYQCVPQNYDSGMKLSLSRQFFDLNDMKVQRVNPNQQPSYCYIPNLGPSSSNSNIFSNHMVPPAPATSQTRTTTFQMFPGITKPFRLL